jgi:VWFA-related protein
MLRNFLWPVALLASSCAFSQQSVTAPQGSSLLHSRADLVLVPVIVHDSKDQPMAGLGMDRFRVEENGHARTLSIFEETAAPASRSPSIATPANSAAPSAPAGEFANFASGGRPQRLTIVVLDTLNTPYLFQTDARRQIAKYLAASITPGEQISLIGIDSSGLHQIHSFTADTRVLIAALDKAKSQNSATEMNDAAADSTLAASNQSLFDQEVAGSVDVFEAFFSEAMTGYTAMDQRDAAQRTLRALNEIAVAYSGIPGRKTLIWVTAGFPFMIDDPNAINYMGLDLVDAYEETWRALMSANLAVYPVDVQGLLPQRANGSFATSGHVSTTTASKTLSPAQMNQSSMRPWNRVQPYDLHMQQQQTMRAFAQATGGEVCLNFNDLAKCAARAESDSSAYYTLGFYLPPDDRAPGWRKLKVEVDAKGAHVRTRQGFYVPEPAKDDEAAHRRAIATALASPIEFTEVPMSVRWTKSGFAEKPGAQKSEKNAKTISAALTVTIPAHGLALPDTGNTATLNLFFVATAFNENGKEIAEREQTITARLGEDSLAEIRAHGVDFPATLDYSFNAKEFRFALRDNASGSIGTVIVAASDAEKSATAASGP